MPPHSRPPKPRSVAVELNTSGTRDSDQRHLILAAILALSLLVLWFTNGPPPAEPANLAFIEVGDTSTGIVLTVAVGLWAAGCKAIRKPTPGAAN